MRLLAALLLAPLAALHAADASPTRPNFILSLIDDQNEIQIEGKTVIVPKLNVLLIMADDLRDYGGAFTSNLVKTPNLDRLRARGTTFERAYVQYPVCNPSRSSLPTGLRAEQTGIVGNDLRLREQMPDIVTLPQLGKERGAGLRGDGAGPEVDPSNLGDPIEGSVHHDNNTDQGQKSARFEIKMPQAGRYEVRLAYTASPNRASNVPVTIESAEGAKAVIVNQKLTPKIAGHFISLGTFSFAAGKPALITIRNDGTDGYVAVDAVQLVPVEQ
ncbi:MAG: sulfatase-like hydrolase/transferase [Roseimicrobium sp.]